MCVCRAGIAGNYCDRSERKHRRGYSHRFHLLQVNTHTYADTDVHKSVFLFILYPLKSIQVCVYVSVHVFTYVYLWVFVGVHIRVSVYVFISPMFVSVTSDRTERSGRTRRNGLTSILT